MDAPDNYGLPTCQSRRILHVVAENHESLQDELGHAVEQIQKTAATGDLRGILITRRSQSLFTVEASFDVPYGTTLERDRWHRVAVASSAIAADKAAT